MWAFLVVISLIPILLATASTAVAFWYWSPDIPAATLERQYATATSRFVEVDGLRLHVDERGSGPALVMVHGFTSNLFAFEALAERLSDRYRVVSLDLPGHGLTGPDPRGRYRNDAMADLLLRAFGPLGIDRAVVIGNSLGADVAWRMAARDRARVRGLVLIAPPSFPAGTRPPLFLRLLGHPVIGRILLRFTPEHEYVKRLRATWGDPSRLRPEDATRDYRLLLRTGNRDALVDIMNSGSSDGAPTMSSVAVPTLLLWGTKDSVVPPSGAERVAAKIDGARIVSVEGAGHTPMTEDPDATAALVEGFLAGLEEGATPSP